MILMYGAPPHPFSPRIPEGVEPLEPFVPYSPFPETTDRAHILVPPAAQPRGEAVDQQVTTPETLLEVEAYASAMIRYLSLPREQRAAVDRHIQAARVLTGRVELDAEIYETARKFAEMLREKAGG
jgi:hypothetical protein